MSVTVQWLVGVAAGLTAAGVIWRKAVRPVVNGMAIIAEAAPILLDIASEYKPNGNGSLADTLDRVDQTLGAHVTDMGVLREDVAVHIAADAKAFEEIAEFTVAQRLAMKTTLETAAALKADTVAIAAAVKAKAEETASALHTETEEIAGALAEASPSDPTV